MTTRSENRSLQYCALAYKGPQPEGVLSLENVVMILVRCSSGTPYTLVNPNWLNIVEPGDWEYVEDMLKDFEDRLIVQPDNLIRQASSLSVGPLITYATGLRLADNPELVALGAVFSEKPLPCC